MSKIPGLFFLYHACYHASLMGCITPPDWTIEPPPCGLVPYYTFNGYGGYGFHECVEHPCEEICLWWGGGLFYLITSDCPECPVAWYQLATCTCTQDEPYTISYYTCIFNFIGCTDTPEEGPPPIDPCDESSDEAFILANKYGLNPPRLARGGRHRTQNTGKFEPDHAHGAATRTIVLASYIDKTNILIKYEPANLEP